MGALDGRQIVITGGAGGIARASAELLLADGARLLLIDPNAAALEALAAALAAGERVRTAVSLLESPEACAAALAGVAGPVYALVHLAGVFRPDALDAASPHGTRPSPPTSPTRSTWRRRSGRASIPRRSAGWCSRARSPSGAARPTTSPTAPPRAASSGWCGRSPAAWHPRCWSTAWRPGSS